MKIFNVWWCRSCGEIQDERASCEECESSDLISLKVRPKPVLEGKPQAGETWYVQLWNGGILLERRVQDITPKTVLLSEVPDPTDPGQDTQAYRYRLEDVRLVERAEEKKP